MSERRLATLVIGVVVALTGCSSAGGSGTARGSASVTAAPAAPSVGAVCARAAAAGTLAVSIEDFAFKPASIAARVGQVVAFANTGFEHHNATLDTGGCGTGTLQTGGGDGLVFAKAGRYGYHCTVHTWMTGTIHIAE